MRRIVIAGAVAAAIAAGCGADSSESEAPVSLTAAPPVDATRSGVGVVAEGCSLVAQLGSGVVLGPPGHVVTAAHTIAGATMVTVVDRDGGQHAATVRAFDADADLAVVNAPTLDAPQLVLAGSSGVGPGSVVVWSREGGVSTRRVEVTRRLAITIEDIYIEDTGVRSGIEIGGDIEVGNSGAAVVDAEGEVIGIVYASSRERDQVAFATDVTEIADLLATIATTDVDNGRCI